MSAKRPRSIAAAVERITFPAANVTHVGTDRSQAERLSQASHCKPPVKVLRAIEREDESARYEHNYSQPVDLHGRSNPAFSSSIL